MKVKLIVEIDMDLDPNEAYLPQYALPENRAIERFLREVNGNLTYLIGTLEHWELHDRIKKWKVTIE